MIQVGSRVEFEVNSTSGKVLVRGYVTRIDSKDADVVEDHALSIWGHSTAGRDEKWTIINDRLKPWEEVLA